VLKEQVVNALAHAPIVARSRLFGSRGLSMLTCARRGDCQWRRS
jgi:hypothetical protein